MRFSARDAHGIILRAWQRVSMREEGTDPVNMLFQDVAGQNQPLFDFYETVLNDTLEGMGLPASVRAEFMTTVFEHSVRSLTNTSLVAVYFCCNVYDGDAGVSVSCCGRRNASALQVGICHDQGDVRSVFQVP